MSLGSFLDQVARFLSPSGGSAGPATVPEWQGWIVLGALLTLFGLLVWWLYFSPLPGKRDPLGRRSIGARDRLGLAALVLLSGCLFVVGTRWDELWHRVYGGFGDDFLWPPHLLIYGSLGLNSIFAGFGLGVAVRGPGGLRDRFRANPLVGLLGLLSAYQLASIPSDLTWHKIIGPDISAWSLPHLLLEVSSSAVLLIGLALALSARPTPPWRIAAKPGLVECIGAAVLVVSTLAMLQFGVTEWEWGWQSSGGMPFGRPVWVYPVVVLAIGVTESHLALFTLRRVGVATLVALSALLLQTAFAAVDRAAIPPGPVSASYLLLVLPAVILDAWYAYRLRRPSAFPTLVVGAVLFGGVYVAEAVLSIGGLIGYPPLSAADVVQIVAVGLLAALILTVIARAAATWLNVVAAESSPSDALLLSVTG